MWSLAPASASERAINFTQQAEDQAS